ncbi:MAG: hypothetical protein JRJ84_17415 [Deltaproteobacteria bacterium]|nr:hypothetical protein [Deltaproteobacteria bacterium]
MTVTAHTLVSALVRKYPYTEEVFAWHGVTLDPSHMAMSLYALCWVRGIELQQVLSDVDAIISAEEDATEELTADEWSDEARKPHVSFDWEEDAWDYGDFLTNDAPDLKFEDGRAH